MKPILLISILLLSFVCNKNLKENQDPVKVEKSVDPKAKKSRGEFSNIAPDATKVVRPQYARKKLHKI